MTPPAAMPDLLELTGRDAGKLLAGGEVSPAELADAYLDRIEQDPDETNAFLHVDRSATHASVAHAETLGADTPLRGVLQPGVPGRGPAGPLAGLDRFNGLGQAADLVELD